MPKVSQAERPLVNHVTRASYRLVPAIDIRSDDEAIERIVSICNEPSVYAWLFRARLSGCPYTQECARHWIRWSSEGWSEGTHFVFAAVGADGLVAAACDIKSDDSIAEIGYWCSERHRGIMTNAVVEMCSIGRESGFRGFYARTKHGNVRSEAVLERCGFALTDSPEEGYRRFELSCL